MNVLSQYSFIKLAKWNFNATFRSEFLQEGDYVRVNNIEFRKFVDYITKEPPTCKFNLIVAGSDPAFDNPKYKSIQQFVIKVYAINNISDHAITIPLGFKNDDPDKILNVLKKNPTKDFLLYMNFNIGTFPRARQPCYDYFINKDFVTVEALKPETAEPSFWRSPTQRLNNNPYLLQIARSKYVLCPRGNGIDSYRVYECLYFNSIPILNKDNIKQMTPFFSKMPAIIVTKWSDVTKEFLEKNYDECYKRLIDWKEQNDWTTTSFWMEQKYNDIENCALIV